MHDNQYPSNAFWTAYLIFGIGCIIFFFFGVCALLCCCRNRFRGMERKGYVIRDPTDHNQPLIQPGMPASHPGMITSSFPAQPPYPQAVAHVQHNPPQAPPPYDLPAKY